MRVVFFGTPTFAVPTLDALLSHGVDVAAVVTQPDRPGARSHSTLVAPPVKQRALQAGIEVLQPDRPRGPEFIEQVRNLAPDLGVVVAYGNILRPELLAIPRLGMVNVHASLLPRWRGAAPIHWAVLSGDVETGVSIMRVEAGLDSGAVWLQRALPIGPTSTTGELFQSLATLGAAAMVDALPRIEHGEPPTPQDQSRVTIAPKVNRAMARVDWQRSAAETSHLVRAMDPAPGAWTTWQDTPLKLFAPSPGIIATQVPPGTVRATSDGIEVACGDRWLAIAMLQPAGRPRLAAADWLRGQPDGQAIRFA